MGATVRNPYTTGRGTPSRFLRRRARESQKYLIAKRHGLWWKISPTGTCQPCASWRVATSVTPWTPRRRP